MDTTSGNLLGSARLSRSGKRTRPVFNRWKRPCSVPFVASARKDRVPFDTVTSADLCGNQHFTARSPRHRRDACSMAWRCRSITARWSQHGRVLAVK